MVVVLLAGSYGKIVMNLEKKIRAMIMILKEDTRVWWSRSDV